jgi:hypothetical protein
MLTHTIRIPYAHLIAMVCVAYLLRACMFTLLIQPGAKYNQPDTPSYHEAAIALSSGHGMHHPVYRQPLFWRTAGYPAYLAPFYRMCARYTTPQSFDAYRNAHHAAIWTQILLTAFIPLLVYWLARLLSGNNIIALCAGWFFVVHLGSILASTYLLTEGIGTLFFYSFLIALFYQIVHQKPWHHWSVIVTALLLGIYTWIRPMGECIGITTTIILLLFSKGSWSTSFKKSLLFGVLFACMLMPWYVRNYQLTHDYFFCPVSGIYFTCFSVPKILRRIDNSSIEDAWKKSQANAQATSRMALQKCPPGIYLSPLASKASALPIILAHPFWFAYDWFKEVFKTTFDLYAYQLVTIYNNCFSWDPIEEFLSDKIAACLYKEPTLPWWARLLAYLEVLVAGICWVAIAYGIWLFIIRPLVKHVRHKQYAYHTMSSIWWVAGIVMAATVGMTGGFGYARLRLPCEPLIVILALIVVYHVIYTDRTKRTPIY